jgi:hypothetical protein
MGEITYADIEKSFSKDDLVQYNLLCSKFVKLTSGKNNAELWDLVQSPTGLRITLDEMHNLREKYDLLKGVMFFNVWRFNPQNKQKEELRW